MEGIKGRLRAFLPDADGEGTVQRLLTAVSPVALAQAVRLLIKGTFMLTYDSVRLPPQLRSALAEYGIYEYGTHVGPTSEAPFRRSKGNLKALSRLVGASHMGTVSEGLFLGHSGTLSCHPKPGSEAATPTIGCKCRVILPIRAAFSLDELSNLSSGLQFTIKLSRREEEPPKGLGFGSSWYQRAALSWWKEGKMSFRMEGDPGDETTWSYWFKAEDDVGWVLCHEWSTATQALKSIGRLVMEKFVNEGGVWTDQGRKRKRGE